MMLTIGNRYYEVMQEFETGMKAGLLGYLQCGKAIIAFKEEKLWRLDGGHVKSFGHFVKQVLHISPAQAHRMAQVHRELGHLLPNYQIDISKVTLLLPLLHDQPDEKKIELLDMAKDLSLEDVKNNVLEMQGKGELATDVCLHEETESMLRCLKCGKWLK